MRLWVDDIELSLKHSSIADCSFDNKINISTDITNKTLTISVIPSNGENMPVNIYNIIGTRLYAGKMDSNPKNIEGIFKTGQIYFVQIGTFVKKIKF